jgi:lysophospholipase L1-like esterase
MSASSSRFQGPRARGLAVLGGVLLSVLGVEFGYRGLSVLGWLPGRWIVADERRVAFREHIAGGVRGMFEPKAFVGYVLRGEGINEAGFSDREWALERREGVFRVACLGGSTTQDGQRVDRNNTYASYLSRMIARRMGGEVEVLNFGVNGWTSAESLVNYALVVARYEPDVVVVHHAVNDVWPRLHPGFRSDYTHYRVPWEDARLAWWDRELIAHSRLWVAWRQLDEDLVGVRERVIRRVDGEPVPIFYELEAETSAGYRGNLERLCRLVRGDGAVPVLLTMPYSDAAGGFERRWVEVLGQGTREHNAIMREVAASEGALLADAAQTFSADPGEHEKFFKDYVHVRPGGNRVKAISILEALRRAKVLE